MLSVLDDEQYKTLAEVANTLSLDILTEVSNEEEMQRAIALKANIIGINNRNLRDLSTDLATSERLIPMLEKATHDYVVISESGIYTHSDVLRLSPLCQGFLVGSALMSQEHLPQAVKSLIYGAVKVCGLTSAEQAQLAFNSGASYGGLIFAEKSPRCVDLNTAQNIVKNAAGSYVGVFVNHDIGAVVSIAQSLNLTAVQLHGNETSEYRQALRETLPERCQIWQAIGVKDTLPAELNDVLNDKNVNYVLLDCQVGSAKGGTGERFNWSLLNPIANKQKLILAGGISPANIAEGIKVGCAIIDVNSGVETSPGVKSAEKLADLFSICRRY